MLQKYNREWEKCGGRPAGPGIISLIEIDNETAPLNDEIFYDVERGVVILYSEGAFYESQP